MSEPPVVKSAEVKRIWQKIESDLLFETDLEFDPSYVPYIFVENILLRTLSRMVAQGPKGPVTIKCTDDGSIAVVSRGGAYDDYERLEHPFAAAAESHVFTFSQQVERIDVFTYDGKCDYELTRDLIKGYGDKVELFEDSFYSLDFYTRRIRATCKSYDPKESGTNTTLTTDKLVDSAATFSTNSVGIGDVVANITDGTYASVTAVDSETQLSLSADIFPTTGSTGESYSVEGTRVKVVGFFRS